MLGTQAGTVNLQKRCPVSRIGWTKNDETRNGTTHLARRNPQLKSPGDSDERGNA